MHDCISALGVKAITNMYSYTAHTGHIEAFPWLQDINLCTLAKLNHTAISYTVHVHLRSIEDKYMHDLQGGANQCSSKTETVAKSGAFSQIKAEGLAVAFFQPHLCTYT